MITCIRITFLVCALLQVSLAFAKNVVTFELANPFAVYTHEVDVNVVRLAESEWRSHEIQAQLEEAANVYAQCGVRLNVTLEQVASTPDGVILFDLEGYSDPNEMRELNGALNLAKLKSDPRQLNVFFMQSFDPDFGTITATAVPELRVTQKEQRVALNTVWMSYKIERQRNITYTEGGFSSGYSVLAHEFGHVLLNARHIEDPYAHNLMHAWGQNHNGRLTLGQCGKIRKSPLVRAIATADRYKRECQHVYAPLLAGLHFSGGVDRDCSGLAKIVRKMEVVQDQVSDLQPVKHIDFYLESPRSQLMYLDRQAFSASLKPTYDDVRRELLKPWQAEKLWLHELGHAILNSQLAVDWPWFAARDKLMARWGRKVYQETIKEDSHLIPNFASNMARAGAYLGNVAGIYADQDSSKIINEIHRLPNFAQFEEILAPYHEFFSDALVVIYTQNPSVMKRALQHPNCFINSDCGEQESPEIISRDYSFLRDVDTWSSHEVHEMLTPAHAHLWKKMKEAPVPGRTKKEQLRIVYRALSAEVLTRTADPNLWVLSTPEVNRRMIRLIDQYW